jgi:hypothetical protein
MRLTSPWWPATVREHCPAARFWIAPLSASSMDVNKAVAKDENDLLRLAGLQIHSDVFLE